MRRVAVILAIAVAVALGFAAAGHGRTLEISCPGTDLPSQGGPQVFREGQYHYKVFCSYSDGLYGYELMLSYYPTATPAGDIADIRRIDGHLCTSYQNPPYTLYSPSVVASVSVMGNPKSWTTAFGYAPAFLAQASGIASPCKPTAPPATTTTSSGGSTDSRCPQQKAVRKTSDRVAYGWRFSFRGVPANVTLSRKATSAGSGSGGATTFHCFYSDGDVDEVRTGSGGGTVWFYPRNPPSTATFSFAVDGSPGEFVKKRTVALMLTGRMTRIVGSSCTTGPTSLQLVDGATDSVSVSLCGATLKYVNGHGAKVSVSVG
jgi:uncharacterized Zn-finger protein